MEIGKLITKFLKEHENNKYLLIFRKIIDNDKILLHYLAKGNFKEVVFLILGFINNNIKIIGEKRTNYLGASKYNGRTQIDGETEITDFEKTEQNKLLISSLWKNVFSKGASNTMSQLNYFFSTKKYYQHNIDNKIGDGLNELKKSIIEMKKNNSDLKYDRIKLILGQGNFVFTISEQDWKNPKTSKIEIWEYYDLFRIEKNKIIEHWDIIGKIK